MPKQSKNDASKDAENKKPKNPRKNNAGSGTSEGGEKKRGCPSEYANKVKPYLADIARYARCGVTEGQLCEYYGVGKTSWAKYKKENPELAETLCGNGLRIHRGNHGGDRVEKRRCYRHENKAIHTLCKARRGNDTIFAYQPFYGRFRPRPADRGVA